MAFCRSRLGLVLCKPKVWMDLAGQTEVGLEAL